jgi:hypothetical protein
MSCPVPFLRGEYPFAKLIELAAKKHGVMENVQRQVVLESADTIFEMMDEALAYLEKLDEKSV